jgi:hypothetical protein
MFNQAVWLSVFPDNGRNMNVTYSTAPSFCDGMTWETWAQLGFQGPCPYHRKALRNLTKAEAYKVAKSKNLSAFVCPLSNMWHVATGGFDESDFIEMAEGYDEK